MSELERMSFSIEKPLADKFERLVKKRKYSNRSEFLRDLIRDSLVAEQWESDKDVVATVTLIYDHHTRGLLDKLTHMQHHHHGKVMANTHVHLDHDLCAEMILMKGKGNELRKLADLLGQQKGVVHAAISMSSTGRELK